MPLIRSMRFDAGGEVSHTEEEPQVEGIQVKVPYTAAMLDEAAQAVLEGVEANEARIIYDMWTRDPDMEAAGLYMRAQASAKATAFSRVAKLKHTIRAVLDGETVRDINRTYGEFDLSFESVNSHDHAIAGSLRPLDWKLLKRNRPPGMRYKDIGGSIMSHVENGDTDVVVVAPNVDDKDPIRKTLSKLRLKKIASGALMGDPSVTGGERSVEMAKSVLAGEGKYLVEERAQDDDTKALFAIACHVYDVPLAEWPAIMEKGGTHVVEGCLHYSNLMLESVEGTMGFVRQRYRIDAKNDEIMMGFEGSAAPWYRHKWSEYMRYGVDQILRSPTATYSYKIVSRKADTIFFRILRVQNAAADVKQYYDMPGISMVEVQGFDMEATHNGVLKKKNYTFPQSLWERMVRDATADVMKNGKPDINALAATYRVASVNSSYNGVNPLPTARVPADEVGPLTVHAAIAGYAEVLLIGVQTGAMMDAQLAVRNRLGESTLYKLFATFLTASLGVVALPFLPVKKALDRFDELAANKLAEFLVTWRPVARVKQFKANMFIHSKEPVEYCPNGVPAFRQHMYERLAVDQQFQLAKDQETAAEVLRVCGGVLPVELEEAFTAAASPQALPAPSVSEPPSYRTEDPVGPTVGGYRIKDEGQPSVKVTRWPKSPQQKEERVAAIEEAIAEVHAVSRKVNSQLSSCWAEKTIKGEPVVARFRQSPDKSRNPDAWRVVNGVLTESLLGNKVFSYAAVWLPVPLKGDTNNLVTVVEEYYDGRASETGKDVSRRYFTVGDNTYTGWALVSSDVEIFNGPGVLTALEAALNMSHDYEIVVNQGGAGAGKTTSIVNDYEDGDMVVCPVRMSTDDTRERLMDKIGDAKKARKVVRTVDSLLVHWKREQESGRIMRANVVHADEAYMARYGSWCAVAALLGATVLSAHGDKKQIPYTPRVDVAKLYVQLRPNVEVERMLVYRCAPSIMAIWAPAYDYQLRTPVSDKGSLVYMVKDIRDYRLPAEGSVAVIAMYQADKAELKKKFAAALASHETKNRISVMTAHESEGKTFDHALLVNFEVRPRGEGDSFYFWRRMEYVLVAASRAKRSLCYAKYGSQPDLLTEWMDKARDPRRIRAVSDIGSAGNSAEFA